MVVGKRCRFNIALYKDLRVICGACEGERLVLTGRGSGKGAFHVHHGKIVVLEDIGNVGKEIRGVANGFVLCIEAGVGAEVDIGSQRAVSGEGNGERAGLRGGIGGSGSFILAVLRGRGKGSDQ